MGALLNMGALSQDYDTCQHFRYGSCAPTRSVSEILSQNTSQYVP